MNEDVNEASITKLQRRILPDGDSIWVRIMRKKKILKTTIILESIKKGDSILWKKVINYIKYIGFELKWCIGNEEKVCFSIDFWVYISPFIFFVDENYFYCINWDTKVYNFINFPKCFSKC